jgi:hypothetical protein
MQTFRRALLLSLIAAVAGCDTSPMVGACCSLGQARLRVVNAYTTPVDVLIDGTVVASGLAAGGIDTITTSLGTRTLALRQAGTTVTSSQSVTIAAGALPTVAALRASTGAVSSTVLDDTNSVVPANATKLRVLHFAPNAGTLQVYRTQPDFPTPVSWQFPFTYQPDPTSLNAPFYQSTVGTWEVHIWQTPADASGWNTAPLKLLVPLAGGEKRTIVILDKSGGGVRAEIL